MTSPATVDWERRFARRAQAMRPSALRELLKVTGRPGVISFAGGLPAAELFSLGLGQFQPQQDSLRRRLLPALALDHGLRQMQLGPLIVRFLEQLLARSALRPALLASRQTD